MFDPVPWPIVWTAVLGGLWITVRRGLEMYSQGKWRSSAIWNFVGTIPIAGVAFWWAGMSNPNPLTKWIILGAVGALCGMALFIAVGELISPTGSANAQPSQAPGAIEQHNQGPGQQFNAPGGSIYVNPPPPQPMSDSGIIQQAGTEVGKAFGARRSPTDATQFEFVEITNAERLNSSEPFVYEGVKLRLTWVRMDSRLMASRPTDGRILQRVVAKVID